MLIKHVMLICQYHISTYVDKHDFYMYDDNMNGDTSCVYFFINFNMK